MKRRIPCIVQALLALSSSTLVCSALAAKTDIHDAPLLVSSPTTVQANLLFILDDSGSMDFDFMPDDVVKGFCRSSGVVGSDTAATYSGGFSRACCVQSNGSSAANSSAACWTGAAPFSNRGHAPYLSSSFNGMAYNPATRYLPPVNASGNDLPNQTRANTTTWTSVRNDAYLIQNTGSINLVTGYPDMEWCTDNTFTTCARAGNYVLPGSIGAADYTTFRATTATGSGKMAVGAPDAATLSDRDWGPHYYNIIASEYCDADNLRNCQDGASGEFTIPAPVRWCNSDTNARAMAPATGSCQANKTNVYAQARYPTKYFSVGKAAVGEKVEVAASSSFSITLSGCKTSPSQSVGIETLMVNGVDLLGGVPTAQTTVNTTMANNIRAGVNAKTGTTGYSANAGTSSSVVINAPKSAGALTATLSFTRTSGSNSLCTWAFNPNPPKFGGYVAPVAATVAVPAGFAGSFERVDIIPSRTSYPKVSSRSDCLGATCTYDEEMTNFANWWTYYHTRMQSMKSSASRAFDAVKNNRRVGYMSINNNTNSDFLNLDTFETTQRTNWFNKLTRARPSNSTPLRTALSRAGQLYAGKLNGTSLNGSTVVDPMQFSCQRNFTILSTDGFWNEGNLPKKIDGNDIGDQDGDLSRPMFDGKPTANTLADVAAYYYRTDLRTGTTGTAACKSGATGDDVCGNSADLAVKPDEVQSMKTFTLGLGASGAMLFRSDYLSATSGDYFAVKEGSLANPAAGVCTWQTTGACNWPAPLSNTLTTIDDLWHAAVNGSGTYFSATDPATLYSGLSRALQAIDVQTKAAAAATTSNPNVAVGDNQVFISNFSSGEWSGELESQRLDLQTGVVVVDETTGKVTSDWSARALLDAREEASRAIYMFSSGAANKLKAFSWSSMNATEQGYFALAYVKTAGAAISQFCSFGDYCVSGADQSKAAGKPFVDFIRGDRSNEGDFSVPTKYFRNRVHLLGDIVNSEAVYVSKANFDYTDAAYAAYKEVVKGRAGMVYVGANDGMLHAVNAKTGAEAWAYIPSLVLPNLYRLADKEYSAKHEYFVDGTVTVQDIFDGSNWRTVLVGGLGGGGRGYYALDITDPAAPKALWEFSDTDMGFTMGRAEIGKLADGTWAVFLPSGFNNVSPGDGKGRLYILNAATGLQIGSAIVTSAGDTGTPSGMGHIRAWVDNSEISNSVMRVYGGDNLGNVWRFDVNNNVGAAGYDAQLLATLRSPDNVAQPITSRPELGQVGTIPMVYVGTGRYLGLTDLSNSTVQSIYAIKDRMDTQNFGNPRSSANSFVKQTLTVADCPPGSSACAGTVKVRVNNDPKGVNLAEDGGWYVDLPESRERVNTDPQLVLGTLVVNTNVIETGNPCKVGGSSYANFFDYRTGAPISTAKGVNSVPLGDAIATRPALIKLPNNKIISVSRLSDNRTISSPTPIESTAGATRRLSWRDLIQN